MNKFDGNNMQDKYQEIRDELSRKLIESGLVKTDSREILTSKVTQSVTELLEENPQIKQNCLEALKNAGHIPDSINILPDESDFEKGLLKLQINYRAEPKLPDYISNVEEN